MAKSKAGAVPRNHADRISSTGCAASGSGLAGWGLGHVGSVQTCTDDLCTSTQWDAHLAAPSACCGAYAGPCTAYGSPPLLSCKPECSAGCVYRVDSGNQLIRTRTW